VQDAHFGYSYAGFGIAIYDTTNNQREYLETTFLEPLTAGKKYLVSFYVSLAEISEYSIGSIGAYLSEDTLLYSDVNSQYIQVNPQIENPPFSIISDTLNWKLIQQSYIAAGGEKFITIGNFRSNVMTPTSQNSNKFSDIAYYYIDDIEVKCLDCVAPELAIPTIIDNKEIFNISGLSENAHLYLLIPLGNWYLKVLIIKTITTF
jgi:hypothetical protein